MRRSIIFITLAFRPSRRSLGLIHAEAYALGTDARRRERFLKTTEGKRLLRQKLRDILGKGVSGGEIVETAD